MPEVGTKMELKLHLLSLIQIFKSSIQEVSFPGKNDEIPNSSLLFFISLFLSKQNSQASEKKK